MSASDAALDRGRGPRTVGRWASSLVASSLVASSLVASSLVASSLVALGIVVAGCGAAADSDADREAADEAADASADLSARRGSKMQAFSLPGVDGKPFDVRPYLGRDVVLISFWATWCSPCKAELASMAPVYERLKDRGFTYIAVSTDNPTDAGKVRPYVSSYGYTFPVLLDTQSTLMQRYNPRGDMPFYVLVNRRGEIVEQHQGFSPGDEVLLEKKIESLLGTPRRRR